MKVLGIDDQEYWAAAAGLEPIAEWTTKRRAAVHRLGDEDENAPVVEVLEMPPGYVIVRHSHSCHRIEFVLRGSMYVDGRILGPGDLMLAGPGDFYGPKIAGPDGCVAAEIFAKESGIAGPITYERTDGSTIDVNLLAGEGGSRPMDDAAIEKLREEADAAYERAALAS